MLKKGTLKSKKGKEGRNIELTRSLSARISPVVVMQKYSLGSLDLEKNSSKKKDMKSQEGMKELVSLTRTSSPRNSFPLSLLVYDKNASSRKKITKTYTKDYLSSDAREKLNYLNELKCKLVEIQEENHKYKQQLNPNKSNKKKQVWTAVEKFRTKLHNKLKLS